MKRQLAEQGPPFNGSTTIIETGEPDDMQTTPDGLLTVTNDSRSLSQPPYVSFAMFGFRLMPALRPLTELLFIVV